MKCLNRYHTAIGMLLAGTIGIRTAALRFLFVKTLMRPNVDEQIPFPKAADVLAHGSQLGGSRALDRAAKNLMNRALLMTLYAARLRRPELFS